jgi:signal transduction histidine kinase
LVLLHGGEIDVTSVPDQGTTFRITIPKGFDHLPVNAVSQVPVDLHIGRSAAAYAVEAQRWAAETQSLSESGVRRRIERDGTRYYVLIVDDNSDLRDYLGGLLEPLYDIATASDGVEALESIRDRVPDIVVSDVMMPRLDGFGLVTAIRSRPETASLPVILLSARAGEESAIDGLTAGSDDYLVKPFSARELLARVRTHLQLASLRRAWIEELERANSELDAFSYSVSHDLRAPIRAIDGYTQALAEDYAAGLDGRGQEYVGNISNCVKRMGALVDALLSLAKITRTELSSESVDMSALARQTVADQQIAEPDRRVDIVIQDGLVAHGDRNLLQVVLVNLLGNAWKFTSRTERAVIEFGCRLNEKDSVFFVRDNGPGFDASHASQLFTPFRRLHSDKEFAGTGIGLATVHRIVNRHGGKIWAEAAPGQGATFNFTIPASEG